MHNFNADTSDDFFQSLSFDEIKARTDKYMLDLFRRAPVAFRFGQGEYLYDTDNKQYIDFLCGIAVTSLGHGEADIIEAIRDQAERVIHTSNLFYNQEQALLAEALVEHSFPGKVFFSNSGTEAIEAAFKLVRSYGQRAKDGATRMVSFEGSFHGRTIAGMCLTAQEKIHSGFGPLLRPEDHAYLPRNDIDILEKEFEENGTNLCGLFIELIQGEGGINVMDQAFMRRCRELCDEYDVLLVADEIQTGIGRTGKLFCFENYQITPDIMALAKGLGNGFPIGAIVVAEDYCDYLQRGQHGSTFSGGHLATRVAFETVKIIMTRDILKNIPALSDYFFQRLNALKSKYKSVVDVRGIGLHIGVELNQPCADVVTACRENGLLVNCTAENTIRIMPPLNISLERAAEGLSILEKVFAANTALH
ncbi:MAG: aspartate aminotransferase family protein [Leptospiraceae bacterium]|nr:aspartate aminotransferase family protein [Leptospiraceae bacterium]